MLSITVRRRRPSDTFTLTRIARRNVRRVYRQLREKGFDAWEARGMVLDLVIAGTFATFECHPSNVNAPEAAA